MCCFLFEFGMSASKRLNKKVVYYNGREWSPYLKHKNEERKEFNYKM